MPSDPAMESERAVLPHDCVLAFGLPLTADDFKAAFHDPNRDYARQYPAGWEQYRRNFASHVEDFIARYKKLGVRVVYGLRGSDLVGLFACGSVVTLFTHWTASGIELCDGILRLSSVVDSVPYTFSGVLDLCVCHPKGLPELLVRDRPLCSVRYIEDDAKPVFWLAFYEALYRLLKLGGRTYRDAMTEIILELRRQTAGEKDEKLQINTGSLSS